MGRYTFLVFFAFAFILLDYYAYQGLKSIITSGRSVRVFSYTYMAFSVVAYTAAAYLIFAMYHGVTPVRTMIFNLSSGFLFTMFVSKLVFAGLLLLQDGGRSLVGIYNWIKSMISPTEILVDGAENSFLPDRRSFLTSSAALIASFPFIGMLYGITKGKYKYTVEKITLYYEDLPSKFDGFKIVQISDIHAGSFDDAARVAEGIQLVNDCKPDLFCFTGDLVNSEKEEIEPYISVFSKIEAKLGKLAVLGNHDYYGDYDKNDANAEKAYFDDFYRKFDQMGFDLLKNEARTITIEDQSIHIIGVENWGAGRWFPKKGDLDLATRTTPGNGFNVLLSHDPTHWEEKVLSYRKKMHLTLSGHTHGFQFGIKIPGFKWSPAQYRYKHWLGLYEETDRKLYVNRGFGFLGFPGRVGMWPEVTLIELKQGKSPNESVSS